MPGSCAARRNKELQKRKLLVEGDVDSGANQREHFVLLHGRGLEEAIQNQAIHHGTEDSCFAPLADRVGLPELRQEVIDVQFAAAQTHFGVEVDETFVTVGPANGVKLELQGEQHAGPIIDEAEQKPRKDLEPFLAGKNPAEPFQQHFAIAGDVIFHNGKEHVFLVLEVRVEGSTRFAGSGRDVLQARGFKAVARENQPGCVHQLPAGGEGTRLSANRQRGRHGNGRIRICCIVHSRYRISQTVHSCMYRDMTRMWENNFLAVNGLKNFRAVGSFARITGCICGALGLAMSGLTGCSKPPEAPAQAAMGPVPVSVVRASTSSFPLRGEWVGTMDGYVNAQIQPQVSGYLVRQLYREGSPVSKGQVLFQIDPRPFQDSVKQAEGQLGQAQGQLGQAQAQQGLTQINVGRDTPLAEQRAIAQSQLDNDKQQALQAGAGVRSAQASIATVQAQLSNARLNLGFTQVRSLISGIAGQATVQVGNLVSQQSVLTSVSQLDPIKVYFSISDSEYLALTRRAAAGRGDLLKSSANLPLKLTLANGDIFPHAGHIVFVDRQINQQTGSIRIAAAFPNPGNVLRPGQFARISADTEVLHDALLVPQLAVTELQGVEQIDTVGADNKVHVVNVTLGPQVGSNWVIKSGLAAGAQIIVDNLQKLKDGVPVSPHAAPAPTQAVASTNTDPTGR